jgi:DNA-binding beta-propeller fold protein YncE
MRKYLFYTILLSLSLFLSACGPSKSEIQTMIDKALTTIPTQTAYPTYTLQPTKVIITSTATMQAPTEIPMSEKLITYIVDDVVYAINLDTLEKHRLVEGYGNITLITWSPDGESLYFCENINENSSRVYVLDYANRQIKPIFDYQGGINNILVSPTGDYLLFNTGEPNRDIYLFDFYDSSQIKVATHPLPDYGAIWSPDGKVIYYISEQPSNREIYKYEIDTQKETRITKSPETEILIGFDPISKNLYFSKCGSKPGYKVRSLGTGELFTVQNICTLNVMTGDAIKEFTPKNDDIWYPYCKLTYDGINLICKIESLNSYTLSTDEKSIQYKISTAVSIFSMSPFRKINTFEIMENEISSLLISSDGTKMVISTFNDVVETKYYVYMINLSDVSNKILLQTEASVINSLNLRP